MAPLLALASALFYGAADFMGGLASRAASTIAVVVLSQLAGMLLLAVLIPVLPGDAPTRSDLAWGAAAGVFGSAGVAMLYRALAIGTMAVVAPTTAVCAVLIPVAVGIMLGERPGPGNAAGIVLALVAIVLVSQQGPVGVAAAAPARRVLPPGIGLALLAGVAIGVFLLSLAQTAAAAGLWPLLAARGMSVALFAGLAAVRTIPFRMPPRVLALTVGGGALDMLANALYLVAVREGPLTAVVTLSSLYPASTVLLARVVLHERLNLTQVVGIAAALAAVALIVS